MRNAAALGKIGQSLISLGGCAEIRPNLGFVRPNLGTIWKIREDFGRPGQIVLDTPRSCATEWRDLLDSDGFAGMESMDEAEVVDMMYGEEMFFEEVPQEKIK